MTQWSNEQIEKAKQTRICNELAKCLEAVVEEHGYSFSTPLLEASEKALYKWRNK